MRLADYARSVRHTLVSNRLRAALTLLGTVIGAGSIVLLAGLLRSGEELLVMSSQRASESDLLHITRDTPPTNLFGKVRRELSRRDEANIEASPLLEDVRVNSEASRQIVATAVREGPVAPGLERDMRARLVSSSPDGLGLYHLVVAKGRGLLPADLEERRRTCVLGWEVWHRLYGDDTPLSGQTLRIDAHACTIVGVLKSKPIMGGGGDATWMWNRKILFPETTFDSMFQPDHTVATMYVRLADSRELASKVKTVEGLLSALLLRTHGAPNFKVKGENSSEGQEKLILGVIKGLLLSTALLSLLVGGINIMNIMLVTVTERTREIGVRRALGATPRAISIQFLLEATFIAGVGGLIGVGGGVALTWLVSFALSRSFGSFSFHVETWAIVLGLGLSMSTGMTFGLFPALKASRLDPVEALRFE